ncbi:AEC family transporter [Desulfosarcina ovata]|uniref:Transporter n=1 Tax=Desulfosarcina ovata subsp. ovata TaxID=2752305 RepID=A0A5K8AAC1_9BACT|nr:AEC family transporter [Desulfosarcina ovata]BBO89054.1 hypothetical protein DSCOOX_22340 [Desulfosarcina ovata subsp. ovata]
MGIITTIVPIFIVVAIGWLARRRGFIPMEFLPPANRLVYYLAIPAMIFCAISKGTIRQHFNTAGLLLTLAAVTSAYLMAWGVSHLDRMAGARAGTFIQSAAHGNQGHIGLPLAFYLLGQSGLVKASIIAGFVMILQNVLSVWFLQTQAAPRGSRSGTIDILLKLSGNPIILSAMTGILFAFFQIPVPIVLQRSLEMLGGMAPPMALLLIGASLSIRGMRRHFRPAIGAVLIKLVVLPAIGLLLYLKLGLTADEFLPGLILLASPSATVTFVMAREMQGDPEFAVATISASTLFSAATFSLWLMLVHWIALAAG